MEIDAINKSRWAIYQRWVSRIGPALLMMAVIFAASATPASEIHNFGVWDTLVKKGGHFLGYALLGAAYLRAIGRRRPLTMMLAILLAAIYAMTDEFHQFFTPGRHSSLVDVGIDSLGAAAGVLTWNWLRRHIFQVNSEW